MKRILLCFWWIFLINAQAYDDYDGYDHGIDIPDGVFKGFVEGEFKITTSSRQYPCSMTTTPQYEKLFLVYIPELKKETWAYGPKNSKKGDKVILHITFLGNRFSNRVFDSIK